MLRSYDMMVRKNEDWWRNPTDDQHLYRIKIEDLQEKRPGLQQGDVMVFSTDKMKSNIPGYKMLVELIQQKSIIVRSHHMTKLFDKQGVSSIDLKFCNSSKIVD